jgi:nitrate/nitrite transporter NarK
MIAAATQPGTASLAFQSDNKRRLVAACAAGTVFEWYDFYLCAILAPSFAKIFFPLENETASFLSAFTAYAIGFIVRPFGALLFGGLGDTIGRKYTFLITIVFMGFATFVIGLLPTYAQIGWIAPALLVFLRVLQGLALSGEYGGAVIYVAEFMSAKRRGFATSFIQITPTLGFLLALGAVNIPRSHMTESAFLSWGWRIPFLISLLLLLLTFSLRFIFSETPVFRQLKAEGKIARAPLREALLTYPNAKYLLLVLFGVAIGQGVVAYTAQFYNLFFLTITLQLDYATASGFVFVNSILGVVFVLFWGWLSDRVGRLKIILSGFLLAMVIFLPAYRLLTEAVNPDLAAFRAANRIVIRTDIRQCRFHLFVGPWTTITPCDQVRDLLANSGLSFDLRDAPGAGGIVLSAGNYSTEITDRVPALVRARVQAALFAAGYPGLTLRDTQSAPQTDAKGNARFEKLNADRGKINYPFALALLQGVVLISSMVYGPIAAFLAEFFPARLRYTSVSLTYHVANGWFGGIMPVVAASIVTATGNIYSGLWYVMAGAALSFVIGFLFLQDPQHRPIHL